MDVRLLGPLEVRLEERPIELGPRKQRAVLAMLALEVGRTVSVDRLAEGLWGDEPPPSAPKMLQLYVSHLRRVLDGDASIATRGRGYELQLTGDAVDTVRFERLVHEARAREALALWRGEPLADLAGEPFAAAEIRRLDELRQRATEMAIDGDLEAGRHAALIGELDGLVAAHPLREHLHAQRMLALYRSGRQAEALDAYRDARSALVGEIGVEPGAELRQLQDAMLAQDPALDVRSGPAPSGALVAPRPPGRALLAAAAALLIAGLIAFGVIRVLEPDGLAGIHENAVGVIDPDGRRILAQYAVGDSPSAVVAGAGSVWVASRLAGTVSRIDRDRERVIIEVGGAPAALAFGAGSLWIADGDSRSVAQVNARSNRVVQRIQAGNAPRSLAAAAGALWVASGVDGLVHRIDLDRPHLRRAVAVGANPTAIVAGAGALWVASEESGTVTRIDPRSGKVVGVVTVGNGPSALATGEGAVWVVSRRDGTLSRIDPARNAVAWLVRVGRDPTAVAVGEGSVWVAGGEDGTVARVDPETPTDVELVKVGSSPAAITVADGSVWAASGAPASAHRGGTLRVLLPVEPPMPIDSVQTNGYSWETAMTSSLAYDGLVAYRRVPGVAGATLVGALATTVPRPSSDGRTYDFTLRDGLRYSDGRPVRPKDFRASMERLLRVTEGEFLELFGGIAGARRCRSRATRCDLSRGIETDARARTITVHLTEPDSDFLAKLTLNLAFVTPADTPLRPTADRAPPGTGPYRVATWDPRRGGQLVRNPRFRSSADRPGGYADRIAVELRGDNRKRVEASIAAVQRGDADLTVVANPFQSLVTRDRLAGLRARAPGRVHSGPVPTTDWMFLNVTRRPFDDRRVRRAVNLATDRAALVALAGGPEVAVATCQVVPTAFPGHAPYCPYTARPAPGSGWTAPDPERARRLVAASGRAGERVVVTMPTDRRAMGRYFVRLLGDLGFRASMRLSRDRYFETIYDPRSRAQMGVVGWGADYISPSTFIEPHFACPSRAAVNELNASRVCDRAVTRRLHAARAMPSAEAAGEWAAIDHRIADLAAVVPMTNPRMVVLASERAGNVTQHAQWYTLLDQVWVR